MNKLATLWGCAAVLLVGCGPIDNGPRDIRYGPVDVSVVPSDSGECQCQGSETVLLTNSTGTAVRVPVTTLEREILGNTINREPISYIISANSQKPLACSVDSLPDTSTCTLQRTFLVNGRQYPQPIQDATRDHIRQVVQGALAGADNDLNPTGACVAQCINSTGPCELIDGSTGGDAELGGFIVNLLASADVDDGINIQSIVDLTASQTNECNRTDIAMQNGTAYNFGENCVVSSVLPAGLGRVELTVPENFLFRLNKGVGVNNFNLSFSKSAGSVNLNFIDNAQLQASFGGALQRIDYQNKLFMFETNSHNCIAVKIK